MAIYIIELSVSNMVKMTFMHLGYSFFNAHLLCTSVSRRLLKEDTRGFLRGAEGE